VIGLPGDRVFESHLTTWPPGNPATTRQPSC